MSDMEGRRPAARLDVSEAGAGRRDAAPPAPPPRKLPRWLFSRWVIAPALLAAVAGGWALYAAANDDGLLEGRVLDAACAPVAGATVVLFDRGFVTHQERARARTDAEGRFRFTDNRSHSVQIEAEAPGLGRTERRVVRLYFAGQNTMLKEPLRFREKAS